MNSTELIEAVRQEAFIDDGTAFVDYTDARILIELTDELRTTFARAISQARCGYWLKQYFTPIVPGVAKYAIPPRAITGGLENVSVAASGGAYSKLDEVSETHSQAYELAPGQLGAVQKYVIRGDRVVLLPTPSGGYSLRLSYYLRPSMLIVAAGASAGRIESINTTTREVVVTAAAPGISSDGPCTIDVIHPGGWAELALVDGAATYTAATKTFVLSSSAVLDEIAAGDYVRLANQTDWPCLPEDFHRTLAKSTAAKILTQLHDLQKAEALAGQANSDMQRFADLLVSRVKSEAKVLKAPSAVLQVGRAHRGFYGWRA